MTHSDIPQRANRALHLVLIAFLFIALKVWFLATIKHDTYQEKALKPQRKTVIEPPPRGTIRDRFNLPLALNKVQYNAAVCYDRIREIPLVTWERNERGKRVKVYERRRYIERLSEMLGESLAMDPIEIEDLIYSKASIFPNTPFILKEDISESLYYRLRFLEKDWTGLMMQRGTKRTYPQGKVGSDIIGYLGAINQRQYLAIAGEIEALTEFLEKREEGLPVPLPKGYARQKEVELRLKELTEKAYTIHTLIGKMGIERKCDEALRGVVGKREVELGARGRLIRDLPGGREPKSGNRILLTLSSELQRCAEELLIQNERDRERHFSFAGKGHDAIPSPWIKGGAIVAMIPQTGEIVALASYPRFDPNDFILGGEGRQEKAMKIHQWLENSSHIGALWDGKAPLEREMLNIDERLHLSWENYLDFTLAPKCQLRKSLRLIRTVYEAVHLQHVMEALQKVLGKESIRETVDALYPKKNDDPPLVNSIRKEVDPYLLPIKLQRDKLMFLDLLRLLADGTLFSNEELEISRFLSPLRYRKLNQAFSLIQEEVASQVKALYHEKIFPLWRKKHFKPFLKEKREEEKEKKTYPHPYTDYLEEGEKKLFKTFWKEHQWTFFDAFIFGNIAADPDLKPFLFHLTLRSREIEGPLLQALNLLRECDAPLPFFKTFRSYTELSAPLWGGHPFLRKQTLQGLAAGFYPRHGFGYSKSFAYGRSTPIGSLFKIVTGYEALKQKYHYHQNHDLPLYDLSPFEMIDEANPKIVTENGIVLGRYLDGSFITRHHKGGRMPQSHAPLGKVDFRMAMERSSNLYFSLLASEHINHPADLFKTTKALGFGSRTGIDLYGEIPGYVPDDIRDSKTGLYAFAIGQHSLVVTPLQTAGMLAAIGNGGKVYKPKLIKMEASPDGVKEHPPYLKTTIDMPPRVRSELLEGLKRVVTGEKGPVQPYRIRTLYEHPKWIPDYKALQSQFVGKTSTAEFVYRPTLDRETPPTICKDIWFGALAFKKGDNYKTDIPELAVVVYLRFGDYGKEAAPLAANIIKKWREIEESHYSEKE